MNVRTILATLALSIAGTGCCFCARDEAPAASRDHPASPLAAQAPPPKTSTTLTTKAAADGATAAADGAATDTADSAAPAPNDVLASPVAYTCPHHPKVMEAEAGDCPLCGMALEATTSKQTSPLRQRNDLPTAAPDAAPAHEGHDEGGDAAGETGATDDDDDDEGGAAHEHGGHG